MSVQGGIDHRHSCVVERDLGAKTVLDGAREKAAQDQQDAAHSHLQRNQDLAGKRGFGPALHGLEGRCKPERERWPPGRARRKPPRCSESVTIRRLGGAR